MLLEKIQLEQDEVVLTQVRKHWFILAVQFFGIIVGAIIPLVMVAVFFNIDSTHALAVTLNIQASLLIALGAIWLLIMWMVLFNIWTNYYLDLWVVTTKRLIAIDQRGLFRRRVSSFRLERLQDMTVEINGLLATLLDYGSLRAQTAGGDGDEFIATGLPHPRELKATILQTADTLMDKNSANTEKKLEV